MASLLKSPVTVSLIVTVAVFLAVSYYYSQNNKETNKNKKKKKKKVSLFNETSVLSSLIAGLIAWFVMTYYVGDDAVIDIEKVPSPAIPPITQMSKMSGGNVAVKLNPKQELNSDDPTRSYNLLASGLNIPKNEVKIPSVLINYN